MISRESDYAIRILRKLADGEKHNVKSICESEQIPTQFAYKIVDKLQKKDIVLCLRGKYGGCKLNMDLHDLSVLELLQAIENDCYLNACLKPGYVCEWEQAHPEACRVHKRLMQMQAGLNESLMNMDLYSLIHDDVQIQA